MVNKDIRNNPSPPITEWMQYLNIPGTKKFQKEDYTKRDRLKVLNRVIGLPFLKAQDIAPGKKNEIKKQLSLLNKKRESGLYLFKLLPLKNNLKKIRLQKTLPQCLSWLDKTKIDTKTFRYELIKQPKNITHSAVFCIDEKGIWGELIKDHIIRFSQGTYQGENLVFYYNYKKWRFSNHDQSTIRLVKRAIHKLLIKKMLKQNFLKRELSSTLTKSGYLKGYFEFIIDHNKNISFVDYNRILNKLLSKTIITITRHTDFLHGICIGPGKFKGKVKKVKYGNKKTSFEKNEILVSPLITFQYLPYIKKAGGIITEQGTVLSHAAIVSRELKKPYVANVKDAMKKLKDGDWVTVDADQGKIIIH